MSTVAVTVDYSNGAQKQFSNVPWKKDLTILGALQSCNGIAPGLATKFGSDRSGHALGLVIDEIPHGDRGASDWIIWVNAKPFEGRLGTESSFNFLPAERERNLLKPGDHVLVKLSLAAETPA